MTGSRPRDDWHLPWPYRGCTAFKWLCTAIPTKEGVLGQSHIQISQLICTYLCKLNLVQPCLSFLPLDTIPLSDGAENFSVPSNWKHAWGTCKAHGRLSSWPLHPSHWMSCRAPATAPLHHAGGLLPPLAGGHGGILAVHLKQRSARPLIRGGI